MARAISNLIIAGVLVLGHAFAGDTGENKEARAELPYAVIAALIQMKADVAAVSNGRLKLDVRVRSQNPNVHARDIKLVIRSRQQGDIPLELDGHGSIPATVVPDPELLAETPPATVVANQPKGTMALEFFSRSFPLATTASTQVYTYMACARNFLDFEPCVATLLGDPAPPVRTHFPAAAPAGQNGVPVLVRSGTQELARVVPDQNGKYAIPLQEAWMRPEVELVVPRGTQIAGGQWQGVVDTLVQRYREAFVKAGGKSLVPPAEATASRMTPGVSEKK